MPPGWRSRPSPTEGSSESVIEDIPPRGRPLLRCSATSAPVRSPIVGAIAPGAAIAGGPAGTPPVAGDAPAAGEEARSGVAADDREAAGVGPSSDKVTSGRAEGAIGFAACRASGLPLEVLDALPVSPPPTPSARRDGTNQELPQAAAAGTRKPPPSPAEPPRPRPAIWTENPSPNPNCKGRPTSAEPAETKRLCASSTALAGPLPCRPSK